MQNLSYPLVFKPTNNLKSLKHCLYKSLTFYYKYFLNNNLLNVNARVGISSLSNLLYSLFLYKNIWKTVSIKFNFPSILKFLKLREWSKNY